MDEWLTPEEARALDEEYMDWKEEQARIKQLKEEHKDCNLQYAMAGAPGVGGVITCLDHSLEIENTMRIQEPWEVR